MLQFLSMGIFSRKPQIMEAQNAPQIMSDSYLTYGNYFPVAVTRAQALQVPSIKRCRDLICGTIASIPLEYYKKSTGEMISPPRWIEQPSKSQPRFETLYFTLDSLLMYGVSYWQITETYLEDNRMANAQWVANNRVTFNTDSVNNFVTQYYLDGKPLPMAGVGSLITFQKDEGILAVGGSTIKAALDAQKAASTALETPSATGFLKNSGADLPPNEVSALLAAWKRARQTGGNTAYLTSTLDYQTIGFSPKDMAYQDAIQGLATECARLCSVDPYYVSASMNTTMTYANVQDERKQMVAFTLQPYVSAIESRLSMDDVSTAGHYVKFSLDDSFLRTEPMERLLVLEKMLALGLITTEQAMQMEDLSPNGNGS
ncbi:portal_HK97, phage portal protein, HK97 family [uncultured Caudovirales phage]|uniref:Portal_HK97, phage portal protein, HK97 family n=1 Tax=uncultured Caudovirales phage TaxID=2100421 RepID=A0A6J5LVS6_9CAUD|nr:portal_HK97, phage portal protein, HK97 family [uncultured Caudovirales phage]CAB4161850.1 portal_HK97, phage portal protein, HK97 family [uncultured Caudovirales phage]